MRRKLALCLCAVLISAVMAAAQEGAGMSEDAEAISASAAKELSGMSIVGNDEAPKSLYIVPWKSSEIGVETSLKTMLNEADGPVDRDVFIRQVNFYQVSKSK